MKIGRQDIIWNYAATFLKIGSSVLLLPFILRMMSTEMVGVWTIFMTITAFVNMFDFGFNPSFTRNVTSVFSGVKKLQKEGYEEINNKITTIDFGLLKGLILSMRWFYVRVSIIIFLFMATVGTYYIVNVLKKYNGDISEVYISWIVLIILNTYRVFTFYYDALLLGKGLVKRSKQIQIIGQSAYLIIASLLIIYGYGLLAIVSAQSISIIIVRLLSHRSFYNLELKNQIRSTTAKGKKEVLNAIYPNAIKVGLTSIGAFLTGRASIIIGSLYLSLDQIASYGITIQFIAIIAALGGTYLSTYNPKIVKFQVEKNNTAIKELFLKGQILLFLTYLFCGLGLILLGNWTLNFIGSKTSLISQSFIALALIISFLESNHAMAASILLTKNEVPFFKAALLSGIATIIFLYIFLDLASLGVLAIILAPGIVQLLYQNWKWPMIVYSDLKISLKDILRIIP